VRNGVWIPRERAYTRAQKQYRQQTALARKKGEEKRKKNEKEKRKKREREIKKKKKEEREKQSKQTNATEC